MTITLTIDSADSLPDGGPISYQANRSGFQIGRQTHLDWSLPDPSKYISGLHCEVRYEKDGYWLYDVSSNGTYLNGSTSRMQSPYQLANGDRLTIGHYVVQVSIAGVSGAAPSLSFQAVEDAPARQRHHTPPGDDIWSTGEPAPPPISRRDLMQETPSGRRAPDFSEQFLAFPDVHSATPARAPATPTGDPFRIPASNGAANWAFETPTPVRPQPRETPPSPARDLPRRDSPPSFEPAPVPGLSASFDGASSLPPAMPMRPAPDAFSADAARVRPPMPGPEANPFAPSPEIQSPFARPPQAGAQNGQPFAPVAAPPPPRLSQAGPDLAAENRFMQGFATGAQISPDMFSARDPLVVGQELGEFLKVTVEQLAQLLRARAAAKAMTKSSSRTMVGATDNNPLKFIPGTAEMIDVMFTRKRPGFLNAKASVEAGFGDLKRHEFATFSAMQKALGRLLDDLSPETISSKIGNSVLSSKKSRSWDLFRERWEHKTSAHENGMLDVFLAYFAEAYDEANKDASKKS